MKPMVKAYHLGNRLNLQEIRNELAFSEERREPSFLLFKVGENSYFYLKDYGSVVFFNCPRHIQQEIIALVGEGQDVDETHSEMLEVEIGQTDECIVDFGKVIVPYVNTDIAHIIMLNLAQSVALDHYYSRSENLLAATSDYSDQLERTGKIELNRSKLRMFIGQTMNLKNRIAENLFIFDTPQLAWSKEELSQLDSALNEELDIMNRHNGLQHNIDVIKENIDLFKDILQHKHSSNLELIIILLILLELIHVIIDKLI